MAILGLVLLVLALIVPALHVLFWVGVILLVAGLVLMLFTARSGHGRYWY